MKTKLLTVTATLFVVLNIYAQPVFMKVTMSVGPLLSSGSFEAYASDMMQNLFDDINPPGAPNNAPTEYATLGHRLHPSYILAPANGSGTKMWLGQVNPSGVSAGEGGNTIWASVHSWSSRMFYPTGLVCEFFSSAGNLLGKKEVYSSPNIVYNSRSKSAIWGEGGRRVNDTYIQGGSWGGAKVNEFAFVGSACKTLLSTSQAQADSNVAWMLDNFNDFYIVAVWTLYDEGGQVLARYAKKVQTRGEPVAGTISLTPLGNGVVQVGINSETNRTSFLESTLKVQPTSWQTLNIANAGDTFIFDGPMRYFRLRTEP